MKNFNNIKRGDKLLVKLSQYGDPSYFAGEVIDVTNTRFRVKASCFNKDGKSFTKDGNVYPRDTGFGRMYIQVLNFNAESETLIKKSALTRKIHILAGYLGGMLSSSETRSRMSSVELTNEDLDETLKMLENLEKQLTKYKRG